VTQNVLTKLVRRLRTFTYDPRKGTFRGWLKTLTDHAVLDYLRSNRRNGVTCGAAVLDALRGREGLQQALAEAADRELLDVAAQRAQFQASSRDWQIFRDLALEGRPTAAVAAEHGLTVSAVLMVKCRVKKLLRDEIRRLEEQGAGPPEGEP
jgi:RNA polymerase sigma-70 factor (ECF subfamily)